MFVLQEAFKKYANHLEPVRRGGLRKSITVCVAVVEVGEQKKIAKRQMSKDKEDSEVYIDREEFE